MPRVFPCYRISIAAMGGEMLRLLAVMGVVVAIMGTECSATEQPLASTKVVRVDPRDDVVDVDVRALVQIHFSNGLKLDTITADSVRLLDSAGVSVAARLTSDIEGDVVNLQPAKPLPPRASYRPGPSMP